MKPFALWLKQYRLSQIREHLFLLRDQRDSAIYGIRRYQERHDKLADEIAALESPASVLRRLVRRAM